MATTTAIAYDILARDKGASSTLNNLGDAAESAGNRTSRAGRLVKAGAKAMAVGIGAATLVALRFAKAAADDEVSATKMAVAFKNNAGATRLQIAATEAWITKQGLALGVADDELRPALTRLVTATKDVGGAQRLTSLAMDVAAGRGKSLQTVAEALGRAQDGNAAGLSRLGVATKDASGKALTFDQITKNLAKTFKGQAASAADTTSGKYERVKLAFSEAGEALGYKLMGPLTDMATWLAGTGVPTLDRFTTALGEKVGGATDTVRGKVREVLDALGGLENMNGEAVGKNVAAAIGSGLDQLGNLTGTMFSKLDAAFGDVDWVGLGISVGKQVPSMLLGLAAGILNFDLGGLLAGVGDHWFDILLGVLTIAFAPAKLISKVAGLLAKIPLAGKLLSWMLLSINGVGGRIKGLGGELIGWFGAGFRSALGKAGPGLISRMWRFLLELPKRASAIRGQLGSRLADAMRGAFMAAGEATARGVIRVAGAAKKLPGKIISSFPNPVTLLRSVASQIIAGLVIGIRNGAGRVLGVVRNLAGKIKSGFSKALEIFSPSRVMMRLGGYVTEGLAKGIIGPKTRKLDAAIKKTVAKVTGLKGKLAGLVSDRQTFAEGMNFSSSVFGADYGETGPTVGGVLAAQRGQLAQARQVKADVAKLIKMGLSPSLIRQMQSSGESGIAAMHALASGSKTDVSQLNALDKATQAAYSSAGYTAGNRLYGSQIDKTTGELKGATKLLKVLERLDKNTGKSEVHIHLEGKDIVYSINKYERGKGKKK